MTLALTVGVLGYDPFGPRLAGPALRSWHLALQLARICHVELWTEGPAPDPPGGTNLRIRNFHPELIRGASAQYAGFLLPAQAALRDRTLFQLDCPVVVDCYDPFPAETAHLLAGAGRSEQQFRTRLQAWASLHAVVHGDYHLVATEAQRGYLGGLLVATGRLTPGLTHQDRAIPGRTLLVPTGYDPSAVDLIGRGHQGALALLERWGIRVGAGERFLLWSGGLWPWLDPV
ncbi:MAG TPA: hypothetical protein VEI97_00945, partial [bacterium]|nr:hypothetical protein [bacterium]